MYCPAKSKVGRKWSGVNRWLTLWCWGAGYFYFYSKGQNTGFLEKRFSAIESKLLVIWEGKLVTHSDTYLERCKELNLDTLEKRINDQDLTITYKMVNETRSKNTQVLRMIGNRDRAGTKIVSEPRSLIAQYARTEMRKSSFVYRVMEPWNSLPTALKNARDSKAIRRMSK
jgi:hypothetical protein